MGAFESAVQADPKYAPAYDGRGDAWMGKNDYDKAVADYTLAIGAEPAWPTPLTDRGLAYEAKKDVASARADFSFASDCETCDWMTLLVRSVPLAPRGTLSRAISMNAS